MKNNLNNIYEELKKQFPNVSEEALKLILIILGICAINHYLKKAEKENLNDDK